MTVSASYSPTRITANGVSNTFAYNFLVFAAEDLAVTQDGTRIFTGFTVTGVGDPDGGDVIFTSVPTAGVEIGIDRAMELKRDTDYQNLGDLIASVLNMDFDRLVMMIQQQAQVAEDGDTALSADIDQLRADFNEELEALLAAVGGGDIGSFVQAGTGAVTRSALAKMRDIAHYADFGTTADFNAGKVGKPSFDSAYRWRSTAFIAGTEELSGATLRDAYVVGRNVIGDTNCHGFADRTIMSGVTDSGTYGAFDVTVELQGSNAQDHVQAFQDRIKYTGNGTVNHVVGFYSQPTITGAGVITRRSGVRVRDFIDAGGTSNVFINTGIYIESLVKGDNNFAIVSEGQARSYHGGHFSVGYPTSSPGDSEGFAYVGIDTTGVSQQGINSRGGASPSATFQYSAFNAIPALSPGSYTCQEIHGIACRNGSVGAGATLTKLYGVSIDDLTAGGSNFAIRSKVTAGTNKWNIYQEGDAPNWLSGKSFHGGTVTVPTARDHYAAQTTAAGSAPIKLTGGSLMTAPETGAFEFDGTNLYFTVGGVRKTVTLV